MTMLVAFLVLDGKLVTYKQGSSPSYINTHFSDNLKDCTSDGWKIKIKGASSGKRGRIVCEREFAHKGDLLTKHQEFSLEKGLLIIGLPEYETDNFALSYEDYLFMQNAYFYPDGKIDEPEIRQLAQELEEALNQDEGTPDYARQFIDDFKESMMYEAF